MNWLARAGEYPFIDMVFIVTWWYLMIQVARSNWRWRDKILATAGLIAAACCASSLGA